MNAIVWPYKYDDMQETWKLGMTWIVRALQLNGVRVKIHPDFKCEGLETITRYDWKVDKEFDIAIYNHCDISHIVGDVIPAKRTFFFKDTAPERNFYTLDELGFGPYSSITYKEPPYKAMKLTETKKFFDKKVKGWIDRKTTKWGTYVPLGETEVPYNDYYLVLGQVPADSVVTQHDFGNYVMKLVQVVGELARVGDRDIVVKLHPHTDGEHAKNDDIAQMIAKKLLALSPKVKVQAGKCNVHNFIKNAYCVILANSGSGYEVMMHHKPLIVWGYPEYHWVAYDLRHLADVGRAIKLDWFKVENSNKFLYWYLEKYAIHDQDSADRRVNELLEM